MERTKPRGRLWILPRERVKTDQPHEVPLNAAVIAILESVPRIADSPFVLTTTGMSPSNGYSKGKRRLDALLRRETPGWRLHDMRRTMANGMARLGIDLPVIEKVLNHSSGSFAGIVGVYQRHDFAEEKRAALEGLGKARRSTRFGQAGKGSTCIAQGDKTRDAYVSELCVALSD